MVTSPQIFGSRTRFSSLRYFIELQQHSPGMDGSVIKGRHTATAEVRISSASTILSSIKRLAATPTVHCDTGIQKNTQRLRIIQKCVQCFWLRTLRCAKPPVIRNLLNPSSCQEQKHLTSSTLYFVGRYGPWSIDQ